MSKSIQDADRILIRLPDGMRDDLKALAKSKHRTMTGQVVAILESGLAAEKANEKGA